MLPGQSLLNGRAAIVSAPSLNSRGVLCFLLPGRYGPPFNARKNSVWFSDRTVDKSVERRSVVPAPELNETARACAAGAPGPAGSIWSVPLVALIALSASFLGNDETAGYAEAVPVIGIGVLLIFFPWRAIPGGAVMIGIGGLLGCGLAGFLPARWIGEPEWHSAIRHAIPGLAASVTLQPIHSLLRFGVMLAAIAFAVWVLQWRPIRRVLCFQALCTGIALLATTALAAHLYAFPVLGWHPSQGFGPFPNRNQTATLMALGAMLALGLCVRSFRRRNPLSILWVLALIACLGALLLSNSRAPFCLLIAGSFFWLFRLQTSTLQGLAVAGGVALLICAATLLFGETIARRVPELLTQGGGFRVKIYQDSLRLVEASPALGTGVGNFEAIFPRFREASLNDERVIHPESDWLWMAAEMGLPSVLFCGIGIGAVLVGMVYSPASGEKEIRSICVVALAAFFVNSLIDVPGHRLGTILPVLVVVGLCTRLRLSAQYSKILLWASRLVGFGLMAFGIVLIGGVNLNTRTQHAIAQRDWTAVEKAATESLVRIPLSWSLYITRAYASVHQGRWLEAISDFHHARFLEPKLAVVPLSEGKAWVGINRALALTAWNETLKRSQAGEMRALYAQMLDASLQDQELHLETIRLADGRPSLAILTLNSEDIDKRTLEALESEKSKLSADELLVLTRAQARKAATERDFERAYELGKQAMRPIPFPARSAQTEGQCYEALTQDPLDFAAAFNLCSILLVQGRREEALRIIDPISRETRCPEYFLVMKAETFAAQRQWQEAWNTIELLVK